MEALKILRKHMEGHYLFGNEVSSEQLVEFQKSLVSAMEEYAELRLSNVVGQSEQLPQDKFCKVCNLPTDGEKCYSKRCPV